MISSDFYKQTVAPALQKQFNYDNPMKVPSLKKIVLNIALDSESMGNKKVLENASRDLGLIAGQKAIVVRARKSVAGFKIRQGWPIGCKVTLRGKPMYDFLNRLVCTALPRVRDFRGLPKRSFDGKGNYNFGVKEHYVFPEINYDSIERMFGFDVTLVTSAQTDDEAHFLLKQLSMPIRD